jgi:hypothetical protein
MISLIVEQKKILVELDLSYVEYPIKVLDQKERVTKRKVVKMYKIQWSHHTEEEATWETESYLNQNFRGFLNSPKGTHIIHTRHIYPNLETRFFLRGEGCNTLGV